MAPITEITKDLYRISAFVPDIEISEDAPLQDCLLGPTGSVLKKIINSNQGGNYDKHK